MASFLRKLVDGVLYDVDFLKGHTLQPAWYKVLKIFLIIGFLVVYGLLFGIWKTLLFAVAFILLTLCIHLMYRTKTERFTRSWLDFQVRRENGVLKYERIGRYYYTAVILSAIIAFGFSQLLG